MPCYRPLKGYRAKARNPNGKRSIVFNRSEGYVDQPVDVPCGQCIGCRLERSRQWAMRCVHESQLYDQNCFITLTYNESNLPADGSLNVKHFQDFMKKLRKKYVPQNPYDKKQDPDLHEKFHKKHQVRFFHCGEYGEKLGRPHYHALLFNLDFDDKELWKINNEERYYVSPTLEKIWGKGFCVIGDVSFESAAYCARYITKKVTGDAALDHYTEYCKKTGEIFNERRPEYITMSRRPGIGKGWLEKYQSDVYPHDRVVMRGKEMKPPKFYDSQYEIIDPKDHARIKAERADQGKKRAHDNTLHRLSVKETVKKAAMKFLVRGYEND